MDSNIKGITADSREVKAGYIFVAIKGLKVDGHKFIPEAITRGAIKVYGERKLDYPNYFRVSDSREKLGELASEFYNNPSTKIKVIGVTGTKGKTTTCYLIYHILNSLGKKTGLISSIVAKIGDKEVDTGFHVTNPDVISLNKFLSEIVEDGCKYAVIEVSSHGIDQKRIDGVNFEVGVLTNIAPEHLDYHKTFKKYKEVKMSFINSAKHTVISPKETSINVLPGKFNNLNVEAALGAVEFLGINRNEALKTLTTFKLPEGRLEEINNNKDFRIFIDFAHTPDSFKAALAYLKTQTSGKLIVVFGSAGERDPFKRPKMGKVASEFADDIILTAEDPRSEKVEDIINQIKSGIKSKKAKIHTESDRKKAILYALNIAKEGDLVALLGKGHERSMNLDGFHETPWSEDEVVREYLNSHK